MCYPLTYGFLGSGAACKASTIKGTKKIHEENLADFA